MAEALTDPKVLAELIHTLELGVQPPLLVADAYVVWSKSADDPAMLRLWLIPTKPEAITGDFGAWAKAKLTALSRSRVVEKARVSQLSVIQAGGTSDVVQRAPREPIRRMSASTYIWAEKLGCADPKGGVDSTKAEDLAKRLNARWETADENQFVMPAIDPVTGQSPRMQAVELLRTGRPSVGGGSLLVLYGPGGIGKTFFLRRISHRLTRQALDDRTLSLPAFCQLPALLYADALETWLSNRGLDRLPLPAIRALIKFGVVTPLLDALDELVRGQAREGSIQFLRSIKAFQSDRSAIVLSCRDYYLNVDPLVPDILRGPGTEEFEFGFFNEQGRRTFIQAKTGMRPEAAAKWSQALEREAADTLGAWREVDSLIGHPLFMDAFCAYIESIPRGRQAREVDNFRFSTPDVFRQIVDRVLERETEKAGPWRTEFGDRLLSPWNEPFDVARQRAVLLDLVLRVARDGAELTEERIAEDPRYKEVIHGLYSFSSAASDLQGETNHERLSSLIEKVLGPPLAVPTIAPEKGAEAVVAAQTRSAAFFAQHTLANTEPDTPPDLIFALRHRAYFDYLLAEEITKRLERTVENPTASSREAFIDWCEQHNLFGRYRSAFDFLLWQNKVVTRGVEELQRLGAPGSGADDMLLSYVASLALDLWLRRSGDAGNPPISGLALAPTPGAELWLVNDILPPVVTGLTIVDSLFPKVSIASLDLRDVKVVSTDAESLWFRDTTLTACTFEDVDIQRIELSGQVEFTTCMLDFEIAPESLIVGDELHLTLNDTVVSGAFRKALDRALSDRPHLLTARNVAVLPEYVGASEGISKGRRFLNQLLRLVRKDGRETWGVYRMKLRGRSTATDATFDGALDVLARHDVAHVDGDIVVLSARAVPEMFDGKGRPGRPRYEQFADFWNPVAADLDRVL